MVVQVQPGQPTVLHASAERLTSGPRQKGSRLKANDTLFTWPRSEQLSSTTTQASANACLVIVGRLVSWSVGWLIGLLVGGLLVGWCVGWLVGCWLVLGVLVGARPTLLTSCHQALRTGRHIPEQARV